MQNPNQPQPWWTFTESYGARMRRLQRQQGITQQTGQAQAQAQLPAVPITPAAPTPPSTNPQYLDMLNQVQAQGQPQIPWESQPVQPSAAQVGVPKTPSGVPAPENRPPLPQWIGDIANTVFNVNRTLNPFAPHAAQHPAATEPDYGRKAAETVWRGDAPDFFAPEDTWLGKQERNYARAVVNPLLKAPQGATLPEKWAASAESTAGNMAISEVGPAIKQAWEKPTPENIASAGFATLFGLGMPLAPKGIGDVLNLAPQAVETAAGVGQGLFPDTVKIGDTEIPNLIALGGAKMFGALSKVITDPGQTWATIKEGIDTGSMNKAGSAYLRAMGLGNEQSVMDRLRAKQQQLGADYSLPIRDPNRKTLLSDPAGFIEGSILKDPVTYAYYRTAPIAFSGPDARVKAAERILAGEDPETAIRGASQPAPTEQLFGDESAAFQKRIEDRIVSAGRLAEADAIAGGANFQQAQQAAADAADEQDRIYKSLGMIKGEALPMAEMIGQTVVGTGLALAGVDPMNKLPLHKLFGLEKFMPKTTTNYFVTKVYDALARDASGATMMDKVEAARAGVTAGMQRLKEKAAIDLLATPSRKAAAKAAVVSELETQRALAAQAKPIEWTPEERVLLDKQKQLSDLDAQRAQLSMENLADRPKIAAIDAQRQPLIEALPKLQGALDETGKPVINYDQFNAKQIEAQQRAKVETQIKVLEERAAKFGDVSRATPLVSQAVARAYLEFMNLAELLPQAKARSAAGHAIDVMQTLTKDAGSVAEAATNLQLFIENPKALAERGYGNIGQSVKAELARPVIEAMGMEKFTKALKKVGEAGAYNPIALFDVIANQLDQTSKEVFGVKPMNERPWVEQTGQQIKSWLGEFYLRTLGYVFRNVMGDSVTMAMDGVHTMDGAAAINDYLGKVGVGKEYLMHESQAEGVPSNQIPSKLSKVLVVGKFNNWLGDKNNRWEIARRTRAFYTTFKRFMGLNWKPKITDQVRMILGPEFAHIADNLEAGYREGMTRADLLKTFNDQVKQASQFSMFNISTALEKAGVPVDAISPGMRAMVYQDLAKALAGGADPNKAIDTVIDGYEDGVIKNYIRHIASLGDTVDPTKATFNVTAQDLGEAQVHIEALAKQMVDAGAITPAQAEAQTKQVIQDLQNGEIAAAKARTESHQFFQPPGDPAQARDWANRSMSLIQWQMEQEHAIRDKARAEQSRLMGWVSAQIEKLGKGTGRSQAMQNIWEDYRRLNNEQNTAKLGEIADMHKKVGEAAKVINDPTAWEKIVKDFPGVDKPTAKAEEAWAAMIEQMKQGQPDAAPFDAKLSTDRARIDAARLEAFRLSRVFTERDPSIVTQVADILSVAENNVMEHALTARFKMNALLERKRAGEIDMEQYDAGSAKIWADYFDYAERRYGALSQAQLIGTAIRNSDQFKAANMQLDKLGYTPKQRAELIKGIATPEGLKRVDEILTNRIPAPPPEAAPKKGDVSQAEIPGMKPEAKPTPEAKPFNPAPLPEPATGEAQALPGMAPPEAPAPVVNPNDVVAKRALAQAMFEKAQTKEAADALKAIDTEAPALADALRRQAEATKAVERARKAQAKDPANQVKIDALVEANAAWARTQTEIEAMRTPEGLAAANARRAALPQATQVAPGTAPATEGPKPWAETERKLAEAKAARTAAYKSRDDYQKKIANQNVRALEKQLEQEKLGAAPTYAPQDTGVLPPATPDALPRLSIDTTARPVDANYPAPRPRPESNVPDIPLAYDLTGIDPRRIVYANGPQAETYTFVTDIVPASMVAESHLPDGIKNPAHERPDWQPRGRELASYKAQTEDNVANFKAQQVLQTNQIDAGLPIVAAEKGSKGQYIQLAQNGERQTVETVRIRNPQGTPGKADSIAMLNNGMRERARELGISEERIAAAGDNPMVVRILVSKVDPAEFAKVTNKDRSMRATPQEQATMDADFVRNEPGLLASFKVKPGQSVTEALQSPENARIQRAFQDFFTVGERNLLFTDMEANPNGKPLTPLGVERLKMALYNAIYGETPEGRAIGGMIAQEGGLDNAPLEKAIFENLGGTATLEGLIGEGKKAIELSLTKDLTDAYRAIDEARKSPLAKGAKNLAPIVADYLDRPPVPGLEGDNARVEFSPEAKAIAKFVAAKMDKGGAGPVVAFLSDYNDMAIGNKMQSDIFGGGTLGDQTKQGILNTLLVKYGVSDKSVLTDPGTQAQTFVKPTEQLVPLRDRPVPMSVLKPPTPPADEVAAQADAILAPKAEAAPKPPAFGEKPAQDVAASPKPAGKAESLPLFSQKPAEPAPKLQTASTSVQDTFKLPRSLSGARPRYGYREENFKLNFDNDYDLAAYILARDAKNGKSAQADQYRAALEAAGLDVAEVVAHGQRLMDAIKPIAQKAYDDPEFDINIDVPRIAAPTREVPIVEAAPKPVAAEAGGAGKPPIEPPQPPVEPAQPEPGKGPAKLGKDLKLGADFKLIQDQARAHADAPITEDALVAQDAELEQNGDHEAPRFADIVKASTLEQSQALNAIRQAAKDHMAQPHNPKELSKAQYDALAADLKRHIGDLNMTIDRAKTYGKEATNFALLDYASKRGIDAWIGLLLPFSYWSTRQGRNFALRLLQNPAYLGAYLRYKQALQDENRRRGGRARFDSSIRIPTGDLSGGKLPDVYFDPTETFFPYAGFLERGVEDPVQAKNMGQQLYGLLEKAGLRPSPVIDMPLRFSGIMQADNSPEQQAQWGKGSIGMGIPQTGIIQAATGALGIGGPMGTNIEEPIRRALGLPDTTAYDPYRLSRSVSDMAAEANAKIGPSLDIKPYLAAQEWIRLHGQTDLGMQIRNATAEDVAKELRIDPQLAENALTVARAAAQQATGQRAVTTLAGSMLGLRLQAEPQGEKIRQEMTATERAAAYSPVTGTGSRQDVQTVQQAYPALQAQRQQYYALPGDTREAGYLLDAAQRSTINVAFDRLKDAVIQTRPWDRKAARIVEDSRWAAQSRMDRNKQQAGTQDWQQDYQKAVAALSGTTGNAGTYVPNLDYKPMSVAGANPAEAVKMRQEEIMRQLVRTQPLAENFIGPDGAVDFAAYNASVKDWSAALPTIAHGIPEIGNIVAAADKEGRGPAIRKWLDSLDSAAVDVYRKRADTALEAAQRIYFEGVYTPAMEAYRTAADAGVPDAWAQTVGAVGPIMGKQLAPLIEKVYGARFTPEDMASISRLVFPPAQDVMRSNMSESAKQKDQARTAFWDYMMNQTPPGSDSYQLNQEPLIGAAMDQSSRATLTTDQYLLATQMARGWVQQNIGQVTPEMQAEWAAARQASKDLKALITTTLGEDGAMALSRYQAAPTAQEKLQIRMQNPKVQQALNLTLAYAQKNPLYAKYFRGAIKTAKARPVRPSR